MGFMRRMGLMGLMLLGLLVGCATAQPTATERALYHVSTNWVTNISQVAQMDTNRVVTNIVLHTNVFATYDLHPRESVISAVQAGGAVATTFGFGLGGIIATLLLGAYGSWITWRNSRNAKTAKVFSNNVEVGKAVINVVAGPATEAQYVDAIKSAQVKAGVKDMAAAIVDNNVDTKEARFEAESVVSLAKRTPVA